MLYCNKQHFKSILNSFFRNTDLELWLRRLFSLTLGSAFIMKTVSHGVALFPNSHNTEVQHFICVSAVAAACLKMFLLKGKIQLHYKVIYCSQW